MEEAFIGAVEIPALECRCGTPLGTYSGAIDMYESDLASGYKITPAEFAEKIELYKLRADFSADNAASEEILTSEVAFEEYAKVHFLPYKRYLATNKKKEVMNFGEFYLSYLKTRTLFSRELSTCCIGTLLNPQIMAPNTYFNTVRRKELDIEVANGRLQRITIQVLDVEALAKLVKQSVELDYSDFYAQDSDMVLAVDVRNITKNSRVFTSQPRLDAERKPWKWNFIL